jgi:hypothetical protein
MPTATLENGYTYIEPEQPPDCCCSYVVDRYTPGQPTSSQVMLLHAMAFDIDFPIGLPGSQAACLTAPDTEAVYSVQLDTVEVGTITFAASSTVGTFAAPIAFSTMPGQLLSVIAPSSPDASQSDVTITLVGQCQDVPDPPAPGGSGRSITVIMQATGIVECRLTNVPRPRVRIGANSRVVGRLTNA